MANPLLIGGAASPQSIYELSANTKHHALGTKGVLDDRTFYYAFMVAGTAVFRGYVYSQVAVDANFVRKTTTGTAGQFTLNMTAAGAAPTAGAYIDGYIGVCTPVNPGSGAVPTGGSGYTYKIRSHDTGASPIFTLYDPIAETLASATCTAIPNLYNTPVIATGSTPAVDLVGVPQCNITAAANSAAASPTFGGVFMWVQTWGPCMVSQEGANAVGIITTAATAGATDAGSVIPLVATNATQLPPLVGTTMATTADEEFGFLNLKIRA